MLPLTPCQSRPPAFLLLSGKGLLLLSLRVCVPGPFPPFPPLSLGCTGVPKAPRVPRGVRPGPRGACPGEGVIVGTGPVGVLTCGTAGLGSETKRINRHGGVGVVEERGVMRKEPEMPFM